MFISVALFVQHQPAAPAGLPACAPTAAYLYYPYSYRAGPG
jgi:hypothetical protein